MNIINTPTINDVEFGNIDIHINGNVEIGQIDIGSVQLENNGRKFILDVTSYYITRGSVCDSLINCDIEVDISTFPPDKENGYYNLTKNDLLNMNHGGTATLYITAHEETDPFKVEAIQLWFTANDEYQYISLEEES
jgi:hypothetical protein